MDKMDKYEKAYLQGYEAYKKGYRNPYPINTSLSEEWDAGYNDAENIEYLEQEAEMHYEEYCLEQEIYEEDWIDEDRPY